MALGTESLRRRNSSCRSSKARLRARVPSTSPALPCRCIPVPWPAQQSRPCSGAPDYGSLVSEMTSAPESLGGIVWVGPFAGFYQRFEDLIAASTQMVLYFIHSRRWRENHDAAIKAFLAREGTTMEVFLPDLENHELMYSLARHFDDGPQIPSLVVDGYRYFARLARDF